MPATGREWENFDGGSQRGRRLHVAGRSDVNGKTERLSHLVLEAAADNAKWHDVLREVMRMCGAIKGIITLRDLTTAQLHFPATAASELSAPLIIGIEPEHVASYFDRYAACDVWTPIERRYYPYVPYFMSDHISLAMLQRSEFWQWLEPQGIMDCLVAEIYRSPRHWVALNLHFDESVLGHQREIVERVQVLLRDLRTGWALSERLIGLDQGNMASREYLETWTTPCMTLDEDLVVTSANSLALREFHAHCRTSGEIAIGAPLPLLRGPLSDALAGLRDAAASSKEASGPTCVASRRAGHSIHVMTVAHGTDILGKCRAQFLLLAKADGTQGVVNGLAPKIWESRGLTPSQAAIVKWIAEGGVVPEFAAKRGIADATAYDHLFAARQKLGGMSARDIYTAHQALLLVER